MVFYIVCKTEDEEILIEIPDFSNINSREKHLDCSGVSFAGFVLHAEIETASTIHRIAINSFFIFISSYDVVSQTFKV